ncbi:MAG: F0F1 ATP synthase subunit B [Actinomycetota bacterium]|nr:F0F1 ATP synthase subunit B [Actinomycetota bacterium]
MEILKVEEGLIIWEIIAFFGLLLILRRFAWGPLLGILKEREDNIRESVEKAEQTRVEAARLMGDYKKQLTKARAEAQQIIEQGRKFGDTMKDEIVAKARQEAEQVTTKATEEIAREKDAAVAELQSKVADLTIEAAARVVNKSFDKQAHEKLIDQYLSEVGNLSDN